MYAHVHAYACARACMRLLCVCVCVCVYICVCECCMSVRVLCVYKLVEEVERGAEAIALIEAIKIKVSM